MKKIKIEKTKTFATNPFYYGMKSLPGTGLHFKGLLRKLNKFLKESGGMYGYWAFPDNVLVDTWRFFSPPDIEIFTLINNDRDSFFEYKRNTMMEENRIHFLDFNNPLGEFVLKVIKHNTPPSQG